MLCIFNRPKEVQSKRWCIKSNGLGKSPRSVSAAQSARRHQRRVFAPLESARHSRATCINMANDSICSERCARHPQALFSRFTFSRDSAEKAALRIPRENGFYNVAHATNRLFCRLSAHVTPAPWLFSLPRSPKRASAAATAEGASRFAFLRRGVGEKD